jgi:transposase
VGERFAINKLIAKQFAMKKKSKQSYSIPLRLHRVAGIDCHQPTFKVAICIEGEVPLIETFETYSEDVYRLRDYLMLHQIKDVIIESTGVYWRFLCRVLSEAGIKVVVVNPFKVKQIPLEKTDKGDAVWLATILMNGMAKPSLLVSEQQEALRELTRQRIHYTQQMTRIKNRIIRTLESCNIKIMSVISNISTKTGMKLVEKLSKGITDLNELIECCHHSVIRRKGELLPKAFTGKLTVNHQFQLKLLLEDWEHTEAQKNKVNNAIEALFTEEQKTIIKNLDKIEGIAQEGAEVIMAEMGINAKDFKGEDSVVKYGGFAPGVHESSDKKNIVKCHPGNKYLRTIMIQIAWAAVKNKSGYWWAVYQQLKKSRGAKKAIVAVAHRLLKVVYKVIVHGHNYEKWGAKKYFENRAKVIEFKKAHEQKKVS